MFRRILAAGFLTACGAGLLIVLWPQPFGLQRTMVIAQLVSLRGSVLVIAVAVMLVCILVGALHRRGRRLSLSLAAMLAVFSLAGLAVLSFRGFGAESASASGGTSISVLSWNTMGDAPGPRAIADLAIETNADIIALPETTKETALSVAKLLAKQGKTMQVNSIAFGHVSKARSTSLLTSTTLGSYRIDTKAGSTSVLPSLVATPDNGTGPTIIAIHAVSPITNEMANWRADLKWLSASCAGPNVIMAGDFNSTVDHYSGLAASADTTLGSCTDAAMLAGSAAIGTWPSFLPAVLGAPIDHVMVTKNWHVRSMQVLEDRDGHGSDHRPILVELHGRA